MRLSITALLFALMVVSQPLFSNDQEAMSGEAQYRAAAQKIWDSLDRQQGDIELANGISTLHVPTNFYYLNPSDSEAMLTEIWGNPPGASADILGMLLPADVTLFDKGTWGVTIKYEEDGNVSDEDADAIDYDALLSDMQEGTRESSQERVAQGYEPIELIGWASKPYYDKSSHKLHWAKELRFGDLPDHTLNYNIRVLGREGVLVLNFVASMDQKDLIDSKLDSVLAMAEFNQGSRYEDFNPDLDKVAAYGIGALVAGKVAAKVGFFAAAFLFLKKFGILIVVGIGVLVSKFFKRKAA